jgi:hypothetical protein
MSTNIYIYTTNIYVNCMKIWLRPHDFAIKMMIPLALEAQGVLSQWRGRVFHDGASLTDFSGKSRPKSQLQWDYHGITKTEDPQILDLKRILYPSDGIYILCVSESESFSISIDPSGSLVPLRRLGSFRQRRKWRARPRRASPLNQVLAKSFNTMNGLGIFHHFPMD